MNQASAYAPTKAAIVTRLKARTVDGLAGVRVNYQAPEKAPDVAADGSYEAIYLHDAEGSFADVVMCGGDLRFDETLNLRAVVQVIKRTSTGTQQAADERADRILYEVLDELAGQQGWDLAALDLDQFDYFQVTPGSFQWVPQYFPNGEGHASRVELDLTVRARRSFT